MVFFFKNTNKDITIGEEDEENCRSNKICRFREIVVLPEKLRNHCL